MEMAAQEFVCDGLDEDLDEVLDYIVEVSRGLIHVYVIVT
jgi:hypothetical protein